MVIITFRPPVILFLYLYIVMIARFIIGPNENTWWPLFIIIFLVYLPISVYRRAKSNFDATKALHDKVRYEFTSSQIINTGETFKGTMQWSTIYKVLELKQWFLLYCNRQTAMIIPKSSFQSPQIWRRLEG
jgi:hypothetical protein